MPIDLTGQSFNIAQSIIDKGQSLTLDFSVINSGDEEVAPFSFDIYISQDDEITEDDYKLGYYDIITSLEGGESSGNKSFTYKTPDQDSSFWEDLDGSYKVGIIIDPDNEIAESNEDNNSNVGLGIDYDMIEVGHFDQQAELVGSMVSVADPDITPKDNIDLSFIVDNQSSAMANPYSIDIYLSPGLNAGFDDAVRIGIYDIRDVTAGNGDTGVKKFSYKTPNADHPVWGKGDGTYYIALDIDSKDEVSETNEGNNSGQGEGLDYASFSVTGIDQPADLVVQNLDVPENAQPGDTVTVEYEILNQGGKSAELFAAGFYLFDDDYLANNDSLNYQDVPEVYFSQGSAASSVLSLEPGEGTGVISETITIPETWEGYSPDANYYLGVEADVFDDIDESDEANNSLRELDQDYSSIEIIDQPADLVVQNLDVPENA
ncbi:MAG: CARDB domain-containing protein, partial [Cyanobacteria bacterium P01_G01_bin.19]